MEKYNGCSVPQYTAYRCGRPHVQGVPFETSEKATQRQFMPEKTFELETQSQPEPIVVSTWEELPDGEWLDNDEEGVHWYLDNDGNHWHSTDDGYRLCDETQ